MVYNLLYLLCLCESRSFHAVKFVRRHCFCISSLSMYGNFAYVKVFKQMTHKVIMEAFCEL